MHDRVLHRLRYLQTLIPHPMPRVEYFRNRLTAGEAVLRENTIRLNEGLLEKYPSEMLHQTVAHEFAHLVDYARHGKSDHSRRWQHIMYALNVNPARCHNYDLSDQKIRRQQRWDYECSCKVHKVSSVRHNRIRLGARNYFCKLCGSILLFKGAAS